MLDALGGVVGGLGNSAFRWMSDRDQARYGAQEAAAYAEAAARVAEAQAAYGFGSAALSQASQQRLLLLGGLVILGIALVKGRI